MPGRAEKHRYYTNPLKYMKRAIRESVADAVEATADELIASSKELLIAKHGDGPAWTGELAERGLHHSPIYVSPNYVEVYLFADSTNPNNGAMYAQFLEEGTGDQGMGTGPKWRYKGRDGNWYTTSGMKADPFLEPPIEGALGRLAERVRANIVDSFHTGWYDGSQQLWKNHNNENGGGIRADT